MVNLAEKDTMIRVGLQCAPVVHETLKTDPARGGRFSLGLFNAEEVIENASAAMSQIAAN